MKDLIFHLSTSDGYFVTFFIIFLGLMFGVLILSVIIEEHTAIIFLSIIGFIAALITPYVFEHTNSGTNNVYYRSGDIHNKQLSFKKFNEVMNKHGYNFVLNENSAMNEEITDNYRYNVTDVKTKKKFNNCSVVFKMDNSVSGGFKDYYVRLTDIICDKNDHTVYKNIVKDNS